jgi:hypothetical protein
MASVMAIELQEKLLARERGLDDQEVTPFGTGRWLGEFRAHAGAGVHGM